MLYVYDFWIAASFMVLRLNVFETVSNLRFVFLSFIRALRSINHSKNTQTKSSVLFVTQFERLKQVSIGKKPLKQILL